MPTTPRELVRQALTFQSPQRVPRDLWWQVWTEDRHPRELAELLRRFPPDFATPDHKAPAGDRSAFRIGRHVDAWGCVFENIQNGVIGEVKEPLVRTWADLDRVKAPEHLIAEGVRWAEQATSRRLSRSSNRTARARPADPRTARWFRSACGPWGALAETGRGKC